MERRSSFLLLHSRSRPSSSFPRAPTVVPRLSTSSTTFPSVLVLVLVILVVFCVQEVLVYVSETYDLDVRFFCSKVEGVE